MISFAAVMNVDSVVVLKRQSVLVQCCVHTSVKNAGAQEPKLMKIIRFQYFYLKMELVLNKNQFSIQKPYSAGARIFSVWMLGTSVWLWQGDWLWLFAWQKPKSWISHFLLSAFRLLHFSFSFFPVSVQSASAASEKDLHIISQGRTCAETGMWGEGCEKVTVQRWLSNIRSTPCCTQWTEREREMAIGKGRTAAEF